MAQAYPNSTIVGIDFHPPSIEAAATPPPKAGVATGSVPGRRGPGLPGRGLRSGVHLRRAARHGRPGRRRPAHPRRAGRRTAPGCSSSRWPVTPWREPQPDRAAVLLGLDAGVHAVGAVTARWLGARRAGDRRATAADHRAGRVQPVPPRGRLTDQPDHRGPSLTSRPPAAGVHVDRRPAGRCRRSASGPYEAEPGGLPWPVGRVSSRPPRRSPGRGRPAGSVAARQASSSRTATPP